MVRWLRTFAGRIQDSNVPSCWPRKTPRSPATVKGLRTSVWAWMTGPVVSNGIDGSAGKDGSEPWAWLEETAAGSRARTAVRVKIRLRMGGPLTAAQSQQSTASKNSLGNRGAERDSAPERKAAAWSRGLSGSESLLELQVG